MSLGDYPAAGAPETDSDSDPDGGGNSMAGIVTAGEWNDLDNWGF